MAKARSRRPSLTRCAAELEGRLASQGDAVEDEGNMNSILNFAGGDQTILDWNNFHDVPHLQSGHNTPDAETEASFSNFAAAAAAHGQSVPVTTASLSSTPVTTATPTLIPVTPALSVSTSPQQLHTLTGFIPAEL